MVAKGQHQAELYALPSLVFTIKEPVLWTQLGRQTFPGKCKLCGDGRDGFEVIRESLQQDQGPLRPSRQQQQGRLRVEMCRGARLCGEIWTRSPEQ